VGAPGIEPGCRETTSTTHTTFLRLFQGKERARDQSRSTFYDSFSLCVWTRCGHGRAGCKPATMRRWARCSATSVTCRDHVGGLDAAAGMSGPARNCCRQTTISRSRRERMAAGTCPRFSSRSEKKTRASSSVTHRTGSSPPDVGRGGDPAYGLDTAPVGGGTRSNPAWAFRHGVREPFWLIYAVSDVTPMPGRTCGDHSMIGAAASARSARSGGSRTRCSPASSETRRAS
jgi:hypothetical protein